MKGNSPHRRRLIAAAKVLLATLLLAYLCRQTAAQDGFARLVDQPKDWSLLALAVALMSVVVSLSIIRWYGLVRALRIPFRLHDAFRLGTLAYLLNFVSLGSVGGDLFKAIFIAREQPGRRAEAIATVVLDRIIGLYALIVVAGMAIYLTGMDGATSHAAVQWLCQMVLLAMWAGAILLCLLLIPGFTGGWASRVAARIPLLGPPLERLLAAVRLFHSHWLTLLVAGGISLVMHGLLTLVVYCVASGLPGIVPGLGTHFFIVPLTMVAGAIPATPNGLGTFEGSLELLYRLLGQDIGVVAGTGTIVALGYRVVTVAVAAIAAVYYSLVSGRLPSSREILSAEASSAGQTMR